MNSLRPKAEVRSASAAAALPSAAAAATLTVDDDHDGQRLDNFLIRVCRGVPKSHVYQLIRSGQVRVNGGRSVADRRLVCGDRVRIPPIRATAPLGSFGSGEDETPGRPLRRTAGPALTIVHEDASVIVLDKPAGLAVHGGSGITQGVIEALRAQRPEARFLELVHRLDRETSGALLVARRRPALLSLQQQFRDRLTLKMYLAIVVGRWPLRTRVIRHSLRRLEAPNGDRRVVVDGQGREAQTRVTGLMRFSLDGIGELTLVMAQLDTGRTHQIRVHLAQEGAPIAGDDKYGDFALNRELARRGFRRMFLHAWRLEAGHPDGSGRLRLQVNPGDDFTRLPVAATGRRVDWAALPGLGAQRPLVLRSADVE